jgi:hypothetical protein
MRRRSESASERQRCLSGSLTGQQVARSVELMQIELLPPGGLHRVQPLRGSPFWPAPSCRIYVCMRAPCCRPLDVAGGLVVSCRCVVFARARAHSHIRRISAPARAPRPKGCVRVRVPRPRSGEPHGRLVTVLHWPKREEGLWPPGTIGRAGRHAGRASSVRLCSARVRSSSPRSPIRV